MINDLWVDILVASGSATTENHFASIFFNITYDPFVTNPFCGGKVVASSYVTEVKGFAGLNATNWLTFSTDSAVELHLL